MQRFIVRKKNGLNQYEWFHIKQKSMFVFVDNKTTPIKATRSFANVGKNWDELMKQL